MSRQNSFLPSNSTMNPSNLTGFVSMLTFMYILSITEFSFLVRDESIVNHW